MNKPMTATGESPSHLIDTCIKERGDWRGKNAATSNLCFEFVKHIDRNNFLDKNTPSLLT
jgi:hypothetical protein